MLDLTFAYEKSTKRCYRFQEVVEGVEDPKVGSLYVKKSALGATPPDSLTVTIAAGKEKKMKAVK